MRIVVSGGGTGGHITPILAIVDALKASQKDVQITYIGEKSPITQDLLLGSKLPVYFIKAGKFRRYHSERFIRRMLDVKTISLNIRDSGRVISGLTKSLRLLREIKPDVVFAKGGYVGLPVGLAAGILRIPLVIHESDTRPGLTNRTLARSAKVIAVGWPTENYPAWLKKRVVMTGNPIRTRLFDVSKASALKMLKLSSGRPVVTIMGGSSGAKGINQAIFTQLPKLVEKYQVVHLAGHVDFPLARAARQGLPKTNREHYRPYSFLKKEMGAAMQAADVVVARGGANSFAEIAYCDKPSIIVPHPGLSDQLKNAKTAQEAGAVRVLSEDELVTPEFLKVLKEILSQSNKTKQMQESLKKFAKPSAAKELASLIIEAAHGA